MPNRQRLHVSHLPAAEKIDELHFTAKEHTSLSDGVNEQCAFYC
jgi:hypothetical protein